MPLILLRFVIPLLVALACGWNARDAQAQVSGLSCSFTMSDVDFGSVDVLPGAAIASNGVLSVRCPTVGTVVGSTLYACIAFPTPRRISQGSAVLGYDFYGPSPSTAIWSSTTPVQLPISMLASGGSQTVSISAALLSNQSTAPPGLYGATVTATITYGMLGCSSGAVYTSTVTFSVRANVLKTCSVTAANISFGPTSSLAGAMDAQGQVATLCSFGLGYQLGLDGGGAAATDPTQRQMRSGSFSITYGLYRNAALSLPWGAVTSTSVAGTGSAVLQTVPVYAHIPSQPTPPPGTYSDTVVVTVQY